MSYISKKEKALGLQKLVRVCFGTKITLDESTDALAQSAMNMSKAIDVLMSAGKIKVEEPPPADHTHTDSCDHTNEAEQQAISVAQPSAEQVKELRRKVRNVRKRQKQDALDAAHTTEGRVQAQQLWGNSSRIDVMSMKKVSKDINDDTLNS